jgi:hypothetical protein
MSRRYHGLVLDKLSKYGIESCRKGPHRTEKIRVGHIYSQIIFTLFECVKWIAHL